MRTRLITPVATLVAFAAVARAEPAAAKPVPDYDNARDQDHRSWPRIYLLEGIGGASGQCHGRGGDDGVIVVDNMLRRCTQDRAAIAAVTALPVRYVVNTHFHRDHTAATNCSQKPAPSCGALQVKRVLASGSTTASTAP